MTDNEKLLRAQKQFEIMVDATSGYSDSVDHEKMLVWMAYPAGQISVKMCLSVDVKRQLVRLDAFMPIEIPEEKMAEMACIACFQNTKSGHGCFDIYTNLKTIAYRMTNSFMDSTLYSEAFSYMWLHAAHVIEESFPRFNIFLADLVSLDELISR